MPSSNRARLNCLLIDLGTETMRKYFDSIHPPEILTEELHRNYDELNKLYKKGIINAKQRKKLFPPSGLLSTLPSAPSSEYDIALLFILLRNICGLVPPVTVHGGTSWDQNPPSTDKSPVADLVRIKFYRNEIYGHIISTDLSNDEFEKYWSVISKALERLNDIVGDGGYIREQITYLRMCNLDESTDWARKFLNWWENNKRISDLVVEKNRRLLITTIIFLSVILFLLSYIIYKLHTLHCHWDP